MSREANSDLARDVRMRLKFPVAAASHSKEREPVQDACTRLAVAVWLCVGWGCAQQPMFSGQLAALQQQQAGLAQRSNELQSRATTLDGDNQELERLLAQARQESRVLQDQVVAMREQLKVATTQAAQLKAEYLDTTQRAEALNASLQRRVGASIAANNSLQDRLPQLQVAGVESRVDGDVIRFELAGAKLFEPGSARLTPQAPALIDHVAQELYRVYPDQIIGIEGHTDQDLIAGGKWTSNHHLSVARALAVYDQLISRGRIPASHLFVVGHAANHPVASNGTETGKERNRRVELVVYPDQAPGR